MHACDRETERLTDRQKEGRTEFSSVDPVCILCRAVKLNRNAERQARHWPGWRAVERRVWPCSRTACERRWAGPVERTVCTWSRRPSVNLVPSRWCRPLPTCWTWSLRRACCCCRLWSDPTRSVPHPTDSLRWISLISWPTFGAYVSSQCLECYNRP